MNGYKLRIGIKKINNFFDISGNSMCRMWKFADAILGGKGFSSNIFFWYDLGKNVFLWVLIVLKNRGGQKKNYCKTNIIIEEII